MDYTPTLRVSANVLDLERDFRIKPAHNQKIYLEAASPPPGPPVWVTERGASSRLEPLIVGGEEEEEEYNGGEEGFLDVFASFPRSNPANRLGCQTMPECCFDKSTAPEIRVSLPVSLSLFLSDSNKQYTSGSTSRRIDVTVSTRVARSIDVRRRRSRRRGPWKSPNTVALRRPYHKSTGHDWRRGEARGGGWVTMEEEEEERERELRVQ